MPPRLLRLAENEVNRTIERLPPDICDAAAECATSFELLADALEEDNTLPNDLLGLFEGYSRLDPEPGMPDEMPRIRLFLDSIWEHAGQDLRAFRQEVRITWLHELGHYLGWGEEEIEALGLG